MQHPSLTIASKDQVPVEERFASLRRTGPLLYDSFINHNLYWGSLSVAWGELTGYSDEYETEQTIYYAGRSDGEFNNTLDEWTGSPGEFFAAKIAIPKPHTQSWQALANLKENRNTRKFSVYKRMIHPGEVNRIRSFPAAPHLIATLSDSPNTFVWNTKTQPNREENQQKEVTHGHGTSSAKRKLVQTEFSHPCAASVPDFCLAGHRNAVDFALDTKGSKDVISAGADGLVLLWDITSKPSPSSASYNNANELLPISTFRGHTAPVEDCSFRPARNSTAEESPNAHQLCSVGQDRSLLVFDSRHGGAQPASRTKDIHADDVNCCAWSPFRDWILTGGSDGMVHVFDLRSLAEPLCSIKHKGSVVNVRWSPHEETVFASSDESQFVSMFRLGQGGGGANLLLQHGTHRSTVVDFQFNPINPWVVVSVSDDSSEDTRCGGGTLQTWRVNDLVYREVEKDAEWGAKLQRLMGDDKEETTTTTTAAAAAAATTMAESEE